MNKNRRTFFVALTTVILLLSCTTSYDHQNLTLSILHVNDTHSNLEPDSVGVNMVFDDISARAFLGGFTRLKTAVDTYKGKRQNVLFVHAGDAVQGTLYFTKFQGDADIEFLNLIGIDMMTFGNHEFDLGPLIPRKFAKNARFDLLSANIDFSQEPDINVRVKPYVIKYYDNHPVAIIGVTTEDTVAISLPGPTIKFKSVIETLKTTVKEIEQKGINKIIVLSHIGYDADKRVAQEVSGIDIIIGGHSHTLLGDKEYSDYGLHPEGPYPTVVKNNNGDDVLVVQAWKWGQVLGAITVEFDDKGKIVNYNPEQLVIINDEFVQNRQVVPHGSETYKKIMDAINKSRGIRLFPEDEGMAKALTPLKLQIEDIKKQVLTIAEDDLIIGLNSGPGPLVVDSFIAKTNSEIALVNNGAIRKDLNAGQITLGNAYEVLPFNNTLCFAYLKGSEIKQILEDGIDFQLMTSPGSPNYPYVSGIKYSVKPKASKGNRVYELLKVNKDGTTEPLKMDGVYKFVTISYIAKQYGDGFVFFKTYSGSVLDTGFTDVEAFSEYLASQKTIKNPTDERIKVDQSSNIQDATSYTLIALYSIYRTLNTFRKTYKKRPTSLS